MAKEVNKVAKDKFTWKAGDVVWDKPKKTVKKQSKPKAGKQKSK